mgnify:FL=1
MRCIRNYTRLTVSLIIIVLVVFILTTVNLAYESLQNGKLTEEISKETEIEETLDVDKDTNFETFLNINYANLELWQVEIPKINLIAPIAQDTTQEVMEKYVGHFTKTAFWKGNIGLAAHNRRLPN